MGRKIVLTSGKGGSGKTSVVANLGIVLARRGLKTCLVDADIGLNNLDVALDVENRIVYDIGDIIEKRCSISQALVQEGNLNNLYILPSSKAADLNKLDSNSLQLITRELEKSFDYVIVDCPAGVEEGFHRAMLCANEAIVVVTPHISSVRDADKVISLLSTYAVDFLGIVVNRIRGDMVIEKKMMSAHEISKLLRARLMGVIPEDDKISLYNNIQKGNAYRSESNGAYNLLADFLINGKGGIYDCTAPYKSLINKMFHKIFVRDTAEAEGEI
ncbi:MAG: septum site-determining protein MinD [Christensenellales bacterium]|jgi:septum site-determining protein MinD